jgi:hypothetical protein
MADPYGVQRPAAMGRWSPLPNIEPFCVGGSTAELGKQPVIGNVGRPRDRKVPRRGLEAGIMGAPGIPVDARAVDRLRRALSAAPFAQPPGSGLGSMLAPPRLTSALSSVTHRSTNLIHRPPLSSGLRSPALTAKRPASNAGSSPQPPKLRTNGPGTKISSMRRFPKLGEVAARISPAKARDVLRLMGARSIGGG